MVAVLPVQQRLQVHWLACGVIAIALTYHFSRGDSALFLSHLYCTCCNQTAGTLTCGVIAIALTYHFSRGDSLYICDICTAHVCNQNGSTRK